MAAGAPHPPAWRVVGGVSVASLAAAMATGTAVQVGWLDTSRARWIHHALYAVTLASAALRVLIDVVATASAPQLGPRSAALLPLVVLPRTRGGTPAHAAVAGVTAVAYGVELIRSR